MSEPDNEFQMSEWEDRVVKALSELTAREVTGGNRMQSLGMIMYQYAVAMLKLTGMTLTDCLLFTRDNWTTEWPELPPELGLAYHGPGPQGEVSDDDTVRNLVCTRCDHLVGGGDRTSVGEMVELESQHPNLRHRCRLRSV